MKKKKLHNGLEQAVKIRHASRQDKLRESEVTEMTPLKTNAKYPSLSEYSNMATRYPRISQKVEG